MRGRAPKAPPRSEWLEATSARGLPSIRDAAQLAGISISPVAHVENGRMNTPKDKSLARFLNAYGGMKEKSMLYIQSYDAETIAETPEEFLGLLEHHGIYR